MFIVICRRDLPDLRAADLSARTVNARTNILSSQQDYISLALRAL